MISDRVFHRFRSAVAGTLEITPLQIFGEYCPLIENALHVAGLVICDLNRHNVIP